MSVLAPLLALIAVMLAFLAFIRWDRKRPAKAISREQMAKGFAPRDIAKWPAFLGLALGGFWFGLSEFLHPSAPPFVGKGSTLNALAYNALGERGPALLWLIASAAFAVAAYVSYRASARAVGEKHT